MGGVIHIQNGREKGTLAEDQLSTALAAIQEEIALAKAAGSLADPGDVDELIGRSKDLQKSLAALQFREIDANKDGKIQREEWVAKFGSDQGFDEWDLNSDGTIDAEEFLAMQKAEA